MSRPSGHRDHHLQAPLVSLAGHPHRAPGGLDDERIVAPRFRCVVVGGRRWVVQAQTSETLGFMLTLGLPRAVDRAFGREAFPQPFGPRVDDHLAGPEHGKELGRHQSHHIVAQVAALDAHDGRGRGWVIPGEVRENERVVAGPAREPNSGQSRPRLPTAFAVIAVYSLDRIKLLQLGILLGHEPHEPFQVRASSCCINDCALELRRLGPRSGARNVNFQLALCPVPAFNLLRSPFPQLPLWRANAGLQPTGHSRAPCNSRRGS